MGPKNEPNHSLEIGIPLGFTVARNCGSGLGFERDLVPRAAPCFAGGATYVMKSNINKKIKKHVTQGNSE